MKILILGGTRFVGKHIVDELIAAGHSVSLFNRGQTADSLPPQVERLRGDRDRGISGLDALTGRKWDACIDVSGYTATHVRSSAEKLRGSVAHYIYISAVSVYGDPANGPVDETYPRSTPEGEEVTEIGANYGRLKVTCENIVQEIFSEQHTLLRPQIIAGPYDPEDRFSYWVRRALQEGEMLAPGDGSDFAQFIDARDVARFSAKVCETALFGIYNLAGLRMTWSQFLEVLGARNLVWVPAAFLKDEGVTEFELPLFRSAGGPRSNLMHVCNARAVAAGLRLTDVAVTAKNVREWLPTCDVLPAMSRGREAELIRIARDRKSAAGSS